ncbi:hypothetical protein BC567DRAFT_232429 [Phyllosticta citribraziliensis]
MGCLFARLVVNRRADGAVGGRVALSCIVGRVVQLWECAGGGAEKGFSSGLVWSHTVVVL